MEDTSGRSAASVMTLGSITRRESLTDDIGSRVDRAKGHSTKPTFWNKLLWVVVAMMISFVAIHGTVAILEEFVVNQFFRGDLDSGRRDTAKIELNQGTNESPSLSAARKVVPTVFKWYESLDENELVFGVAEGELQQADRDAEEDADIPCLDGFFETIKQSAFSTSPQLIELVLSNMGLHDHRPTRYHLSELLVEPQDLSPTLIGTEDCISEVFPLTGLCLVAKQFGIQFSSQRNGNGKEKDVIEYLLHVWVVQQTLTVVATRDLSFMSSLSEAADNRRKHVEVAVQTSPAGSRTRASRTIGGAEHAFDTLAFITTSLKSNSGFNGFKDTTQLNILDDVMVAAFDGRRSNAILGLALAATLLAIPTSNGNQEFVWRLGKEWVAAYVAWEFTLLVSTESLHHVVGLMVPSIVCTVVENGPSFIAATVISSALSFMHLPHLQDASTSGTSTSADYFQWSKPIGNNTIVDQTKLSNIFEFLESEFHSLSGDSERRARLADNMGKSNLQRVSLPNPSKRQVESMFGRLCGEGCSASPWITTDTSPQANLDDEDFLIYVAVVVWLTVLISGLGCELLVWVILSQRGWSDELETRWWFAQFCFPLFAMTCFGLATHQNYLALPFLVVGLWKFGMPETLSYMYTALFDRHRSRVERVADLLNSIGTIMHHSSATIVICILLTGVIRLNRYVSGPILILIMQHWFVLTKYVSVWLYSGLELVLEFWFQWVVLSDLQHLQETHWTTLFAALGMLTSHWLYLIAAGLDLFFVSRPGENAESIGPRTAKVASTTTRLSLGPAGATLSSTNANKRSETTDFTRNDLHLPRYGRRSSTALLSVTEEDSTDVNSDCSGSVSKTSEYEA